MNSVSSLKRGERRFIYHIPQKHIKPMNIGKPLPSNTRDMDIKVHKIFSDLKTKSNLAPKQQSNFKQS